MALKGTSQDQSKFFVNFIFNLFFFTNVFTDNVHNN